MNCQFLVHSNEQTVEISSNSNGFLLDKSMVSNQLHCKKSAKINEIKNIFRRQAEACTDRIHVSFQPTMLDCCDNYENKDQIYNRLQEFLNEIYLKGRKIILITNNVKPSNLSKIPRNLVTKVRTQNANLDRINQSIKWITNKVEKEGVEIRVRRDRRDRIMTRSFKSITAIHLEDLDMLTSTDYCSDNGAHLSKSGFERVNVFVQKIITESIN